MFLFVIQALWVFIVEYGLFGVQSGFV